jgi:hypothetical protein
MTHNVENWQALAARLEKLEKQNRRIKGIGIVLLVLAAALVLMGQTPGHRTVEANEFVLKDADGTVRGRWSVAALGPRFVLLDATGKERVAFNMNPGGAGLTLSDASGRARAHLVATVNGPGLLLTDANGKDRLFLFADDTENSAGLGLQDEKGSQPVRLTVGPDRAHLILFAPGERPTDRLIYLEAGPGLGPQVMVKDKEGFYTSIGTTDLRSPRTGATGKTSAASVILFDKDNKVLWQAP